MPQDHDWRSNANYDFVDQLTTSELAWEFLRRNQEYRQAYRDLSARGQLHSDTAREVAEKWGLCFCCRSSTHSTRPARLLDPDCRPRSHSAPQGLIRFKRYWDC
ncbi:transcriptional regulator domain-containing protein [Agrobacterium vitis]|uniref:transcriptional regulator domain-containing protein n=1 Tax=Agrobacterium vitis TaxID=373 RepID=UPI0038F62E50